jgi:hypothetical protein
MSGLFTATADAVLGHIFGKASNTMTQAYVALSTSTPTDAGNVTEPSGNGYDRVTTAATDWETPGSRSISNHMPIAFPTATGAGWGQCTHWCIYSAATGGVLKCWGEITTPPTVTAGMTPSFAANTLTTSVTTSG